jgi:tetratricopeptide (TPR) repeat protein
MIVKGLIRLAALALALATPAVVSAAWQEARSKHFIIYSEQSPAELKDYVTRLEKYDKAIRHVLRLPDPTIGDSKRLTLYVLREQRQVASLIGSGRSGVHGFYIPRASGRGCFCPPEKARGRDAEWELSAEAVFLHEYLHHMMLHDAKVAYPAWMTEGYAEFFASAIFEKDGSIGFGAFPRHRAAGLYWLNDLSLEEMLGEKRRFSGEEIELLYGRGWLLTHYLAMEPSRRGQVGRYLAGIQKGEPPLDAARAAFGDLKQLDADLNKHIKRKTFNYIVVPKSALEVEPPTIRQVSEGEEQIIPVRYLSQRGVDEKEAAGVASRARRIGARFPKDAAVQTAVAEAELDAKNYDAAIAAADLALAAKPDHPDATLFKARALMEKGQKDPASADWAAIRSMLARLNRADPEDPEPLMYFYKSFESAGAAPSRNAVEGLLSALELAPKDTDLRMMVVRRLLRDKKLAEARIALGQLPMTRRAATHVTVPARRMPRSTQGMRKRP